MCTLKTQWREKINFLSQPPCTSKPNFSLHIFHSSLKAQPCPFLVSLVPCVQYSCPANPIPFLLAPNLICLPPVTWLPVIPPLHTHSLSPLAYSPTFAPQIGSLSQTVCPAGPRLLHLLIQSQFFSFPHFLLWSPSLVSWPTSLNLLFQPVSVCPISQTLSFRPPSPSLPLQLQVSLFTPTTSSNFPLNPTTSKSCTFPPTGSLLQCNSLHTQPQVWLMPLQHLNQGACSSMLPGSSKGVTECWKDIDPCFQFWYLIPARPDQRSLQMQLQGKPAHIWAGICPMWMQVLGKSAVKIYEVSNGDGWMVIFQTVRIWPNSGIFL